LKTKIRSLGNQFALPERKKTKRKVDLVSSHLERDSENVPLAAHRLEGFAVSELYNNDRVPSFMRYHPKEGEQLIEEEIYIPDVE
jgi:hypothetical protein